MFGDRIPNDKLSGRAVLVAFVHLMVYSLNKCCRFPNMLQLGLIRRRIMKRSVLIVLAAIVFSPAYSTTVTNTTPNTNAGVGASSSGSVLPGGDTPTEANVPVGPNGHTGADDHTSQGAGPVPEVDSGTDTNATINSSTNTGTGTTGTTGTGTSN